jgi:RNA-directed DNA polymerase
VRQVTASDKGYKSWGNNVFSFAIPLPEHRQPELQQACIELYYKETDLRRPDSDGRRLFLSSEFEDNIGRLKNQPGIVHRNINKIKGPLTIIDVDVLDEENKNIALSKNDFADHILNQDDEFRDVDFSEFTKIFALISQSL